MAKIFTDGKDQIAGGIVYRAGKDGSVEIPDQVAIDDGLVAEKPAYQPKAKQSKTVRTLDQEE
jgi:hypothetical protein